MNFKSLLLTLLLSISLLVVVIDYIYLQQKTRNKFVKLQELIEQEHDLNANWGRLQIEHSTYVNNSRIEETAKKKLGMKLPEKKQIISIKR
jgi:cell division protein FtsL